MGYGLHEDWEYLEGEEIAQKPYFAWKGFFLRKHFQTLSTNFALSFSILNTKEYARLQTQNYDDGNHIRN